MAPSETRDDTGLTLRQLVLEVRDEVKTVRAKMDTHLLEHAQERGRKQGEARLLGFGRSAIALAVSIISGIGALVSVYVALTS